MKDCKYPKCGECEFADCTMESKDIVAILKRRRWNAEPEKHRQKQRDYRQKQREAMPHCDTCEECIAFITVMGNDDTRCCLRHHRMIADKVTTSPQWCGRRREKQ